MLLVAVITPVKPYLVKPIVDEIFVKKNVKMLELLPFVIIMIYILEAVFVFGETYLMNYVGQDLIKRLRDELYSHIQMLSLSFFHKHETGVLMARITNDVKSSTQAGRRGQLFNVQCSIFNLRFDEVIDE